ncbi:MAG: CHAT domain-containing protein [Flavobacteriales bacterium]|nr:CHAT domain-containing protein [Flavobacteriales bacterium]
MMNYRFILSIFFLIIFSGSKGQSQYTDSLFSIVKDYSNLKKPSFANDTLAVNAYIDLCNQLTRSMPDTALYCSNRAFEIAQKSKWKIGMARAVYRRGYLYASVFQTENAFQNYNQALDLLNDCSSFICKKTRSRVLADKGHLNRSLGKYAEAIVNFKLALAVCKEINDEVGIIFQCNALGLAYLDFEKDSLAKASFEEGLVLATKRNDISRSAILIGNIGLAEDGLGDFQKAIQTYEKALEMDRSINNVSGQLRHLGNLGIIHRKLGNLELCRQFTEQALQLSESINNRIGIANNLGNMAIVMNMMGNYTLAVKYNLQALAIQKELNNLPGQASPLGNLGLDYQYLGNAPLALEYHLMSLKLNEQLEKTKDISSSLTNIGLVYQGNGNYNKALEYQLKALTYARAAKSEESEVYVLGNIGNAYFLLDNFDQAENYYNQALVLCRKLGFKGNEANNLSNLANVYYNNHEYQKSIDYNLRALHVYLDLGFTPNTITNYGNIASNYIEMDSLTRALEYGRLSMNATRGIGSPEKTRFAARALYSGFVRSEKLDSSLYYLSIIRNTLNKELETSYFTLSEKEREEFFMSLEKEYNLYYDFTTRYHQKYPLLTDTMYNMVITSKGLSLKSSTYLRQTILNGSDTSLIRYYNQLVELKTKIAAASAKGNETKEMEARAEELERNLIKQSGSFEDVEKLRKLDWKQVRSTLKKGECAIEFVHFKKSIDKNRETIYVALLIRPESIHPELISLCTEDDLKSILGVYPGNNLNYVNSVYGKRNETKTELYDKIWRPLEKSLKGVKKIYYSPSGLLHKVSFSSIAQSQNVYLCDLYQMHQLSSSGKLVNRTLPEYDQHESMFIVGGVEFNANDKEHEIWKYLPGTQKETADIAAVLKKNKRNYLYFSSKEATEENLKLNISNSSFIHISTHGFFYPDPDLVKKEVIESAIEIDSTIVFRGQSSYAGLSFVSNKNPLMRSGIVLAGANDVWSRDPFAEGEDGVLTALEVSNLDLRKTKLVVLSACETALGDIKTSEGVFGLQRAFKMAGAQFLLMSLWQVPDKETAEFMSEFYTQLIRSNDIRKAFDVTQKKMRLKYDPYYWSAFVLLE